jgi:hypothetical protein
MVNIGVVTNRFFPSFVSLHGGFGKRVITGNLANAQVTREICNLLNNGIFKAKKDGKGNKYDANSQ